MIGLPDEEGERARKDPSEEVRTSAKRRQNLKRSSVPSASSRLVARSSTSNDHACFLLIFKYSFNTLVFCVSYPFTLRRRD